MTTSIENIYMQNGPIYIGGPDRCGKTTMQAFLASHPNIAIPAVGSNMWTYFYGQFGDLSQVDNFERCLDALLHYKHVYFLRPDAERIRDEFWQGPPTYARLFALFLIHFAEREGKPRWGAQTGLIERYADQLFAAYPEARVIHLLRDPRDRYEASLAKWPNGKGRVGGATARFLYSANLAERNLQRYPDRYMVVHYEAMVTDPEATLRDVCAFLGEDFAPQMLTMDGAPKHRDRLASTLDPEARPVSPVSADYIGMYQGKVPKREIAFMQMHAGEQMRAHGYKMEPKDFTTTDWLQFVAVDWPMNIARLGSWRTLEAVQHNFPSRFGRKPGKRMIVDRAGTVQQPQKGLNPAPQNSVK